MSRSGTPAWRCEPGRHRWGLRLSHRRHWKLTSGSGCGLDYSELGFRLSRRAGENSVTSTVSETDRPRRADARRNRERILESARSVFAECGAEAQIDDVALGQA